MDYGYSFITTVFYDMLVYRFMKSSWYATEKDCIRLVIGATIIPIVALVAYTNLAVSMGWFINITNTAGPFITNLTVLLTYYTMMMPREEKQSFLTHYTFVVFATMGVRTLLEVIF